jgi:epoxyqueuosine reductase
VSVKPDKERFEVAPSLFLEETIKEYIVSSPKNRLPDYNNDPIFDEPLVGFANGDDAIFQGFKNETIVGDFHLTPREALPTYLARQGKKVSEKQPLHLSVVSCIFPFNYNTRLSTRHESAIVSVRWHVAHYLGEELIRESLQYVISLLERLGHQAVAPCLFLEKPPEVLHSIKDTFSNWLERHVAYAAGLGTFGLSDDLITPSGKAVLCGSLITDLALPPTPRMYDNRLAYCLFYQNGSCQRCIKRCPSGAITKQGHDNTTCFKYCSDNLSKIAEKLGREGYIGDHISCGLCETKVPCEDRIPPSKSTKDKENHEF